MLMGVRLLRIFLAKRGKSRYFISIYILQNAEYIVMQHKSEGDLLNVKTPLPSRRMIQNQFEKGVAKKLLEIPSIG